MATPKWFDYELYMKHKLTQMQESDSTYTMNDLVAAFNEHGFSEAEGAYKHFQKYGHKEDVSPNGLFDAEYYYQSKALQYYQLEENGGMTVDQIKANMDLYAANMKQAIAKAGMDAWTHYTKYGTAEGVNPSAGFDTEAYMEAKYEAWSATEAGSGKTLDEMKAIFKSANINALAHAFQYGTDSTTATAGEAQCWTDENHTALTEDIASNDDDIEQENPGGDYTLTVNEDKLTGTSGDDTFTATLEKGTDDTLQTVDSLDGGKGTDTLDATLADDQAPTLANIENINLRFTAAKELDLSNATGVEKIAIAKSAAVGSVTNMGDVDTIEISDQASGASFDGITAKTLNLNLSKVGTSTTAATVNLATGATAPAVTELVSTLSDSNVTIAAGGAGKDAITKATLTVSGDNTIEFTNSGDDLTSLTVSGDGSLTAGATAKLTALTTLTSSATEGVTVDLTTGITISATAGDNSVTSTGTHLTSATFGDGADTLTLTTKLGAKSVVNMGAGNDTVSIAAAADAGAKVDAGAGDEDTLGVTAALAAAMLDGSGTFTQTYSNFEQMEITAATGAATNLNFTDSGISTLVTNGVTTGALAITGASAGFTYVSKAACAVASTIAYTTSTGTNDTINFKYVADDGFADTAAITANSIENLVITTSDTQATTAATTKQFTAMISGDSFTSVSIGGDIGVEFTNTGTKITSLDASGLTETESGKGGLTWTTGALAEKATITGSAAADTINAAAATAALTITTGGGADVITSGSAADHITFAGDGVETLKITDTTVGANTSSNTQTSAMTTAFDIIEGAAAGMKIDLTGTTTAKTVATANLVLDSANLAGQTGKVTFATGTYSDTGTFTYSASGEDTLLSFETTAASTYGAVVLVGFVAGEDTAAAAGVITLA